MSRAGRSKLHHCNRITFVCEPPRVVRERGAYRPDIDTTEHGSRGTTPSATIQMSWVAFYQAFKRAPNGRARTALRLGRKWPAAVPTTPKGGSGGGRTPRLDLGF